MLGRTYTVYMYLSLSLPPSQGPVTSSAGSVLTRAASSKKSNNKFRYSWHVTDLDEMLQNGSTPTMEVSADYTCVTVTRAPGEFS